MRQKWGGKDFLIGTLGRVWREGLQIGQVNKSVLHLLSVQFPLLLLRGGGLRVGRAASRRGSSSFSQSIETCVYSACCCWADEQQKKKKRHGWCHLTLEKTTASIIIVLKVKISNYRWRRCRPSIASFPILRLSFPRYFARPSFCRWRRMRRKSAISK